MTQRTIKFRAWDDFNRHYVHPASFRIFGDGKLFSDAHEVPQSELRKIIVLEQFTGLHDKNGKEIYEGDIVKILELNRPIITRVYWNDRTARFLLTDNTESGWPMYACDSPLIEVIGNVHENSELLQTNG